MDGAFLPDTFSELPTAAEIARYLIHEDQGRAFPFLEQARIGYLLQQPALMLHGQPCDAYITRATVQGANRLLFAFLVADPNYLALDFLVYVDAAAWQRRTWLLVQGASGFPIQQEALIFHELSHLRQLETDEGEPRFHDDGRPMLALVRHTYELFDTDLLRYGPATLELEQLGTDYVAGAAAEKARRKRGTLKLA